jgi:hypothetical protein
MARSEAANTSSESLMIHHSGIKVSKQVGSNCFCPKNHILV